MIQILQYHCSHLAFLKIIKNQNQVSLIDSQNGHTEDFWGAPAA